MRLYFTLVILAIVVMALSGIGLAWDGSFGLFNVLDPQAPNVSYGRFTQVPLYWGVLQVSHLTNNLGILRATFGIIYGAVTLLALAAAWWVVRGQSEAMPLFIWAALGIGLGTLPGQVCAVCQSTLSVQLFYPILLAILIFLPGRTIPIVAFLVLALFFFHPTALGLFALATGLAFVMALRYPAARRRMLMWTLAFALVTVLATLRFVIFRSDYETGQLSLTVLQARFYESLAGWPIVALIFAWLAGLVILIQPLLERIYRRDAAAPGDRGPVSPSPRLPVSNPERAPRSGVGTGFRGLAPYLPFACLALSGILFVVWAADPHRWAQEVNFREMAPFVALPFILMAMIDGLIGRAGNRLRIYGLVYRVRLVQLTGLIFFLVITIQGLNWVNLTNRLQQTMRSSPTSCISASTIAWLPNTPLEHWSLTTYSLLIQSRRPDKVVMPGNGCVEESFADGLPVAIFGPGGWTIRDWQHGWFDLSVLHTQLTAMQDTPPSCQFPLTWGWYGIERDGENWHRWTSGRARVRVLLARDTQATLRGQIVAIRPPNQVDLLVNGALRTTLDVTRDGWQSFGPVVFSLHAGENTLEFVSHNPPVTIPTDSRELAIAVMDPSLTLADGTTICR
jgi:hypothetical protein